MGKGQNNPFFDILVNSKSRKSRIWNLTTDKVYENMNPPTYTIPRMHSCWIPAYKKLMKDRERAQIDDGYRLYEKFPWQRARYRTMWVLTICAAISTLWQLAFFMKDNRP